MKPLIQNPEPQSPNHVCVDVHYRENYAIAAGLLFSHWNDDHITGLHLACIGHSKPYKPGKFFERELPCILQVLNKIRVPIDVVVIDGYVWLDKNFPGLGTHVYHALGGKIPVIGVAKSKFREALHAQKVFRGRSSRPLYITAIGIDPNFAANCIKQMHGKFRIPTLLKKVDCLCRDWQKI